MRTSLRIFASQVALHQDAVARKLGLTSSDMKCFRVISTYGPMTPGELARRTGFTTGGITKILDHLETRGAITRRYETLDRRTIKIEADPLGKATFGDADVDFDRMVSQMMQDYGPAEARVIKKFLDHSSSMLTEATEKLQVDTGN